MGGVFSRRAGVGVLALLLLSAPFTLGAWWAFPIGDDGWLWLLLKEQGAGAIVQSFNDRPVNARLWALLAVSEDSLFGAAMVAQAVLWPVLGVLSALLWRRLFPDLTRYAWLVASASIAPFVTKVHMVAANVALGPLPPVVLAYGALLLVLRFVAAPGRAGSAALLLSVPMLMLAVLIQEYALPVVLVGIVLLAAGLRRAGDGASRARTAVAIAVATLTAGAAYAVYLGLADPAARSDVNPSYALKLGSPGWLPVHLVVAMWQAVIGGFARSLAEVAEWRLVRAVGVGYGMVLAGLLVHASRPSPDSSERGEGTALGRDVLLLSIATGMGLFPVIAMGRIAWDPGDGLASRFGLPVLPVLAGLVVRGAIGMVAPRFWVVPVVLIGLVAGSTTITDTWSAVRERRTVAAMSAALQTKAAQADGLTVAVVALPERALGPRRQWELTARLTANWTPDIRGRFWAYRMGGGPPLHYQEEATRVFGPRERCTRPERLERTIRLVHRSGGVGQLLYVAPDGEGSFLIEPYCLAER
jgi:hypothetical protein